MAVSTCEQHACTMHRLFDVNAEGALAHNRRVVSSIFEFEHM